MTTKERPKRLRSLTFAVAGLAWMSVSFAHAADPLPAQPAVSFEDAKPVRDFELIIAIPAWLPWTNGTIQTGPAQSDIYLSGWDALRNLNMMFVGEVDLIIQERFTTTVENFYANIGTTAQFGRGSTATLAFKETVTDARVGYRFLSSADGWIEAYAGARWWDIRPSLTVAFPGGRFLAPRTVRGTSGDSWVDPILGFRTQYNLTDHWYLTGQGDIGGFSVGSDFAWRAQIGAGYQFNEDWALDVQYKVWGVDYDNNEPDLSRFAFDVIQQGPQVRLEYSF